MNKVDSLLAHDRDQLPQISADRGQAQGPQPGKTVDKGLYA